MRKTTESNQQMSFSEAEYRTKKKLTRRDIFLSGMEQVVPWSRLIAIVEPHYPKSGKRGRPPIGIERMLRMYFIQQWYGLADVAVEDAIYDSQALRKFCGIDLAVASVPDSPIDGLSSLAGKERAGASHAARGQRTAQSAWIADESRHAN